jgi:hypothetical protein
VDERACVLSLTPLNDFKSWCSGTGKLYFCAAQIIPRAAWGQKDISRHLSHFASRASLQSDPDYVRNLNSFLVSTTRHLISDVKRYRRAYKFLQKCVTPEKNINIVMFRVPSSFPPCDLHLGYSKKSLIFICQEFTSFFGSLSQSHKHNTSISVRSDRYVTSCQNIRETK